MGRGRNIVLDGSKLFLVYCVHADDNEPEKIFVIEEQAIEYIVEQSKNDSDEFDDYDDDQIFEEQSTYELIETRAEWPDR